MCFCLVPESVWGLLFRSLVGLCLLNNTWAFGGACLCTMLMIIEDNWNNTHGLRKIARQRSFFLPEVAGNCVEAITWPHCITMLEIECWGVGRDFMECVIFTPYTFIYSYNLSSRWLLYTRSLWETSAAILSVLAKEDEITSPPVGGGRNLP